MKTITLTDDLREDAENALSYDERHRNEHGRGMVTDALRAILRADDPDTPYAEEER